MKPARLMPGGGKPEKMGFDGHYFIIRIAAVAGWSCRNGPGTFGRTGVLIAPRSCTRTRRTGGRRPKGRTNRHLCRCAFVTKGGGAVKGR